MPQPAAYAEMARHTRRGIRLVARKEVPLLLCPTLALSNRFRREHHPHNHRGVMLSAVAGRRLFQSLCLRQHSSQVRGAAFSPRHPMTLGILRAAKTSRRHSISPDGRPLSAYHGRAGTHRGPAGSSAYALAPIPAATFQPQIMAS